MAELALANVVVACPHCRHMVALYPGDPIGECRKCHRAFANCLVEMKPGGAKTASAATGVQKPSLKLAGAEIPAYVFHSVLGVMIAGLIVFAGLVVLRVARPDLFKQAIGAADDVIAVINQGGDKLEFVESFTFFVPAGPDGSEGKWPEFYGELKKLGATGFTRWKVEGSADGTTTSPGWFVFMAVAPGAEKTMSQEAMKEAYQKVYGADQTFFVMKEELGGKKS